MLGGFFRMPLWMREYLRNNFRMNENMAPKIKMGFAVAYAVSAMILFNYSFIRADKVGFTDEENALLSSGEKAMIKLNVGQVKMLKYKSGEGWSSNDVTLDEVKDNLEQKKSALATAIVEPEEMKE